MEVLRTECISCGKSPGRNLQGWGKIEIKESLLWKRTGYYLVCPDCRKKLGKQVKDL